jgi:MFS family permease
MTPPETAETADRRRPRPWWTFLLCFLACFGGWTVNAMDVLIFRPALPALAATFKEVHVDVHNADVVLIGTAVLLTSASGGWLAGALSDRIGRLRTLRYMIAWFAAFTALCGLLAWGYSWLSSWSYVSLFFLRVLVGIGFGGQWAAAAVLVAETFGNARRGWWVGCMQSGWAVGWLGAELTARWLDIPHAHASWKLFFIGAALALPVILVSLGARESPKFETLEATRAGRQADFFVFLEIFSPGRLRTTFWACMLSIGAQSGYYAIILWLPAFLEERGLMAVLKDLPYLLILIAASFAGYLASALSSDIIGRRSNFRLFAFLTILTVLAHLIILKGEKIQANEFETIMRWMALPLGFFASGAFSGMGAFFTELFPVRMSGSAVGFTYNFGRGFAALILWFIPWVADTGRLSALWTGLLRWLSENILPPELPANSLDKIPDLGLSIGLFVLIAYGLLFFATLWLPETRGKDLDTRAE